MSSIDTKDKKTPDLEAIAKRYALLEEDNELSQIVSRGTDALHKIKFSDGTTFRYEKEGVTRYNEYLSEQQKSELAIQLAKELVYHAYVIQYGMRPKDLDGFFSAKSKSGRYMSDGLLESEFGTTRYGIRKWLEDLPKVTTSAVAEKFEKLVDKQRQKIQMTLNTEAAEAGPDKLKEFIKKTMDKRSSDAEKQDIYAKLDKSYSVEEILPFYGMVANYFKPAKEKKK